MRASVSIAAAIIVLFLCACTTSRPSALPPEPGTPLARISLGMDEAQVLQILGAPTDMKSYATGKSFIPFFLGSDTRRTEWVFSDHGRVLFTINRYTGEMGVIEITR